jgi:hypothetical protein
MGGAGRKAPAAARLERRALAILLLGLAASTCLACASAGRRPGPPPEYDPSAAPWDLPLRAFPSQRLFQGSYEGPEGGGSFRATLRLQSPDRFRLDAADRLGRLLWSIGVEGGQAWWVDHHRSTWCPDLSRLTLPALGSVPLPATALPAIMLGALPVTLTAEPGRPNRDRQLGPVDVAGGRWSATLVEGRPVDWTVADGQGPLWWWRRQGRGGILSQRQGRQLRWQETVVEPLRGELPPLQLPRGYAETCDDRPARSP